MSRGFTAHRRSCAATAASAGPARPRALTPLFMAGEEAKIDQEVLAKVQGIVVSQLAVEESQVVPEASFTQDLGADSLDTVELIMALEEGFDVSFWFWLGVVASVESVGVTKLQQGNGAVW